MTTLLRACALDLRIQGTTHRLVGGITLAALALAAATGAVYVALVPAAMWASGTVSGFFALRDRDRLGILQATLGVGRREAVTSRYLVVLAVPALLAGLFALVAATRTALGAPTGVAMARMGAGLMVALLVYAAIQLAVSFRLSGPTAQLLSIALVMALIVGPVMALGMGSDADANAAVMNTLGTLNPLTLCVGAAAALAYPLSWATTVRAVARQDL